MALIETLEKCKSNTASIRNVCILAHVDHGKTTVADQLLSLNRIVSKRLAGSVRYLDDREDEQIRGITMKSSCVSLVWQNAENENFLVNLVDTPGHIDFATEVAAAVRVCDGAIIVVDVVEGVCVQTKEAIKRAFDERVRMVLVVNKFDKLIAELRKSLEEIFQNVIRIIEDCNAYLADLIRYESAASGEELDEEEFLFFPDVGNVVFASSLHGWGFTVDHIAELFVDKIQGETVESLRKQIWDFDYYVDNKSMTIKRGAINGKKENLFVQLCLKTIYHIYLSIVVRMERDKVDDIIKKLKISTTTRDMYHSDPKIQVKTVLHAWCPLAETVMRQTTNVIQPPTSIPEQRIKYLLNYNTLRENQSVNTYLSKIIPRIKLCSPLENTVIAYVSKMFWANKRNLSQNRPKIGKSVSIRPEVAPTEENVHLNTDITTIALARVFTGTLHIGQEIYHIPSNKTETAQKIVIKELYMLYGRELLFVESVQAGNVCGIGGLSDVISRKGTLSTDLECVAFVDTHSLEPVVRNSIEPVYLKDLPELRAALRVLMLGDSCLQVVMQESGELVLVTAGDVHLAKCMEDLKKLTEIPVKLSDPMVSLRETVVNDSSSDIVEVNDSVRLTVTVVALPDVLINVVQNNFQLLQMVEEHAQVSGIDVMMKRKQNVHELNAQTEKTFQFLSTEKLKKQFDVDVPELWRNLPQKLWSVGKVEGSVNLLINATSDYARNIFCTLDESDLRACFDHCVVSAFDSFTRAGPICGEPLKNCAFVVTQFELENQDADLNPQTSANIQLLVKSALRDAFEKCSPRLMEPVFTTDIEVNTNILGKVYGVIARRHGKVLQAMIMDEQEKTYLVKAELPVIESMGFANEIRKATSGQAIPNLKFDRYEMVEGNPFVEPTPDDEEDEEVSKSDDLRAHKLMIQVRRRKGLNVDEQVVVHAEKQRTLNKKK